MTDITQFSPLLLSIFSTSILPYCNLLFFETQPLLPNFLHFFYQFTPHLMVSGVFLLTNLLHSLWYFPGTQHLPQVFRFYHHILQCGTGSCQFHLKTAACGIYHTPSFLHFFYRFTPLLCVLRSTTLLFFFHAPSFLHFFLCFFPHLCAFRSTANIYSRQLPNFLHFFV